MPHDTSSRSAIRTVRAPLVAVTVAGLAFAACRPPAVRPPPASAPPAFMPASEPDAGWTTRSQLARLRLQNPTFAVVPPRDPGVWFVGEREGRIVAVAGDDGAAPAVTVLDLRAHTLGWQDCGLLNMAFHPEFGKPGSPNRGFVYVWYNHTDRPHPGPNHPHQGTANSNRLVRYNIPDGTRVADPASALILIEQGRTNIDHHGGGMFFHPDDGFLYIGVGDGGHAYFESRGAFFTHGTDDPQRIDRDLLSGVLRIDVDRRGGEISHPVRRQPKHGRTQGYFVPNDNPWLDPAGGVLEEFFAIGLRNPHRMSYDATSKRIFVGDVGEGRVEEIDVIERGGNYQWNFLEGDEPYSGPRPARLLGTERDPLYTYPHRNTGFASVVGGVVYRGRAHPELVGRYVFGDTGSGEVWAVEATSPAPARPTLLLRLPQEMTAYGGLSSFAEDADGELYLVVLGRNQEATGSLQKLVRRPAGPRPAPATLSQTRLFADTATLTAIPALFPYEVNAPFWSDHAIKSRWLHVPPGAKITFRPEGDWSFPAGTVAVKHFDLALDERDPSRRRRLETRVLVVDGQGGAYGRIYKWRADQRDADLMTAPATERLTMIARRPFGPLRSVALGKRGTVATDLVTGGAGPLTVQAPPGETAFAHVSAEADFDIAASWSAVDGGASGFMVRDGLEPTDSFLLVAWQDAPGGKDGRLRIERRERGAAASTVVQVASTGPWLRVRRQAGAVSVYTGADGHLWREVPGVAPLVVPGGHVGIAATSAGASPVTARLSSPVRCETRDHYYPSNEECLACHTASAQFVLGASTRQWNRTAAVPSTGAAVNQLVLAGQRGLLDTQIRPEQPARWRKLAAIDDAGATLQDRVRSYLDANCSQCHRPGQVVQVGIDARYDTPLQRQGLLRGGIRSPSVPRPDEYVVAPKDVERSRLLARVARHRMPPLGSVIVNQAAVDLMREWILSLEGQPALASARIAFEARAGSTRVELRHPDPQARIHFTTDGSAPSPETPWYAGPFVLTRTTTVRALAVREGHARSRITSQRIDVAGR